LNLHDVLNFHRRLDVQKVLTIKSVRQRNGWAIEQQFPPFSTDSRPEKYGADLLSEISQLLNGSLGRLDDDDSATVASLALDGLIALCRAEVVDLRSVWDLLAPKLNQDPRFELSQPSPSLRKAFFFTTTR